MNKPTPEELQNFFRSEIFQSESARNGDYTLAIKAFYERFFSEFDQSKYIEIGVHIDQIRRERLILDEHADQQFNEGHSHDVEYKTIIDFHFIREPGKEQSFSLIGTDEEKAFFDQTREELLSFFILRFRRFSKLLIY